MDSNDRSVLKTICDRINSVMFYCEGCRDLDDFESNKMRVEAVVFNFLQIGELAKSKLSDEAKELMPDIPWHMIYGMRNRIVHGYEGVDLSIVWDTVKKDFPNLKEKLEKHF